MLTTWISLSGIEWVMLIFKYSEVWNVFTSWLCSVDSFSKRWIHEMILPLNQWLTLTSRIYGADRKNLRQNLLKAVLVIHNASWWTTMQCPPVIFIHINFTLIVKHSLKHPTLTFNICHSAVEQSPALVHPVHPGHTMHDLRAQLDVPVQSYKESFIHIKKYRCAPSFLVHAPTLRKQFCMSESLRTGSQKSQLFSSVLKLM